MIDPTVQMIFVDLFAGAGGVTTGVEKSLINGKKVCKVIAAVNHDELAIKSHAANHPDVVHFIEDIRMLNVYRLLEVVNQARVKYPNALLAMWASLECTNFSKAKGGQPREADSRTLAYSLYQNFDARQNKYIDGLSYIQILNPDIIYIENVEEFMSWGPLDESGRPISMKEGSDYMKWTEKMQSFGYNYSYRLINSADHGAFTSRKRFFAQFVRYGMPIVWPEANYAKKKRSDVFGSFKQWKAVREVLDLTDEGNSIFTRKTPLAERTHERIYHGLIKLIGDGTNSFLLQYHGKGISVSIDGPATTITTRDRLAFIKTTQFMINPQFNNAGSDIEKPCFTLIARMDKRPPYLVSVLTGKSIIVTYPSDSEYTVKIKMFMAAYGISDIKIRMLKIPELKLIMGFPKDYILLGTQGDQKKFIGNAVETTTAQRIIEASVAMVMHRKGELVA